MTEDEIEITRNIFAQWFTLDYGCSPHTSYLKQVYEGIITYRLEVLPQLMQVLEPGLRKTLFSNGDVSYIEYNFARHLCSQMENSQRIRRFTVLARCVEKNGSSINRGGIQTCRLMKFTCFQICIILEIAHFLSIAEEYQLSD